MERTITTDVAIIGAGPAGSIAGAWLSQQGRDVHCFERGWFPRFVIGESLLPRCNQLLDEVGMLDAVKKRGYLVKPGAAFLRGDEVARFTFAEGLDGDFPDTYQVPRDDFDQTLATEARRHGAKIHFGQQVESVSFDDGVELTVKDVTTDEVTVVRAKYLMDCSGYGRVLPRLLDLNRPSTLPPRAAIFTQVEGDHRPEGDLEGEIWITVHPENGWQWTIPFSNGRTSIGAVVDMDFFDALEGSMEQKFWTLINAEPNNANRMRDAVVVRPVAHMTAWSTKVERLYGDNQPWVVAGNAGDFLDPIFSSGVALALESSLLAAKVVHRILDGDDPNWQDDYLAPMHRGLEVFRAFVISWYSGQLPDIFFSNVYPPRLKNRVTSILGGNVTRTDNGLVMRPVQMLDQVHKGLAFKIGRENPDSEGLVTKPVSPLGEAEV